MEELTVIEKLFGNVVILISVIGLIKNVISVYFLSKYKKPENIESDFDVTNYNNELDRLHYHNVMYLIFIWLFVCYMTNTPFLSMGGSGFGTLY